jgi:hypothetical protein
MDNYIPETIIVTSGLDWWIWWLLITTTFTAIVVSIFACLVAKEGRHREKICPEGHRTWNGKKFCATCGGRLKKYSPPRCPNGHKVRPDDAFCGCCGRRINNVL